MLEGERRPGHFRGVATVYGCSTLRTQIAILWHKDYQQLAVIRKWRGTSTSGLVCLLKSFERATVSPSLATVIYRMKSEAAVVLSRSLNEAREAFVSGERSAAAIQDLVENLINTEPLAWIDYVAVVDAETLLAIERIERSAVVLLAAKFGATRLIDNIVLSEVS